MITTMLELNHSLAIPAPLPAGARRELVAHALGVAPHAEATRALCVVVQGASKLSSL